MTTYTTVRVKIVREFTDEQRAEWGGRYLGQVGNADTPKYIVFDDADVAEVDG